MPKKLIFVYNYYDSINMNISTGISIIFKGVKPDF